MAKKADSGKKVASESTPSSVSPAVRLAVPWHRPLLPVAAGWLAEQRQWPSKAASSPTVETASAEFSEGSEGSLLPIDLASAGDRLSGVRNAEHILAVLPSRRAKARLRSMLQRRYDPSAKKSQAAVPRAGSTGGRPDRRSEETGQSVTGESVIVDGIECLTVGELAGRMIQGQHPVASAWEQTLAWSAALKASEPEQVRRLVPIPPAEDAVTAWADLGNLLRRLHTELAAETLSFEDVLSRAQTDVDRRRWQWLGDLHRRYLATLQEAGLSDLNELALQLSGTNRSSESNQDASASPSLCVVLVGVTDLSPLLQRLLDRTGLPVYPLVACPEGDLSGFDRWGNVVPDHWASHHVPLDESQLVPASDVEDQVRAVTEVLCDFGERHRIDQVAVGVTDESQVQPLETYGRLLGVPTYRYLGYTLRETAVGRLLNLVVAWLQRRSWRTLASLVRHGDVFRWLDRQLPGQAWLPALDQFMADSFPHQLDAPLPELSGDAPVAARVRDLVHGWLSPLQEGRRPIGEWSRVLREVLAMLYPALGRTREEDAASNDLAAGDDSTANVSRTASAVTVLDEWLRAAETLTDRLDPPVDGPEAIEMLAVRSFDARVPQPVALDALRIFGWLDLVLEDAPALVVCGLNHPFVPEPVTSDPFLPVDLRRELHQLGNDRRYARDVHALHQMLAMRKDIRFIVGTHAADGSPTPPSRLIAACDAASTSRRMVHLLTHKRPAVEVVATNPAMAQSSVDPSIYQPPPPEPLQTIPVLSVTSFSAYLKCPYRFYLRHVLNLRPLDDAALELAANQFGDLIHNTLEDYGKSDAKHLTDPGEIREALIERLRQRARLHYGDQPSMTVQLQVRQAEQRLEFVADAQAKRMAEGWRIFAAEKSVDEKTRDRDTGQPKQPTGITVDGHFVGLRGRFDRIDFNERTNQWAILDYKTHRYPPEKKHRKTIDGRPQWVDLQLPLYRRVVPDLGIPADPDEVQLGYFNIAEKASDTKVNVANFSAEELSEADELIAWCIRQILAGRFAPTDRRVDFDDYADLMNQKASGTMLPASDATTADDPGEDE